LNKIKKNIYIYIWIKGPERSLYDLSGKKVTRNKKDSKIRKTFEDLQKELNNLENDLKNVYILIEIIKLFYTINSIYK